MKSWTSAQRVLCSLLVSSAVSLGLYTVGALHYGEGHYWYLCWNLGLAWLPVLFAWLLGRYLRKHSWRELGAILLTLLWLGFLPNSFYIVSDIIHMQLDYTTNPLYTTVMLVSFSLNGLILGFLALYLVHQQLVKRLSRTWAHSLVACVLLLCSFAIYLGRYLRWNTWDVLVNPAGLLFDVSDRIINPSAHPQTFATTATFFLLLGSTYVVIWQFATALKDQKHT